MQVLYPCCCGIDIAKKFVVACLLTTADGGTVRKETRTFGTMTRDLLALLDWLTAAGCMHVAMDSTSAYWRPVYYMERILDEMRARITREADTARRLLESVDEPEEPPE